jgi:hypothetical protein
VAFEGPITLILLEVLPLLSEDVVVALLMAVLLSVPKLSELVLIVSDRL